MIVLDTKRVNIMRTTMSTQGESTMVALYAHRGVSAELPENTMPAFARAIDLDMFGIELDVHLTRDGVPVVIHDETVDRTTNGSGAIADMDIADLRRFDAGGGTGVPTLVDVLDLVGDRLHVNIEVKAAAAAEAVLAETAGRAALRFAISSFNHDVLRYVRTQSSTIELWPLTVAASDDVLTTAAELKSTQINIWDTFVNREIVDYCRSREIGCWVWTVNDPERARELEAMGVVGLCTDDPAGLNSKLSR
jgi:glycerophosphoryl diester phosphodiesterase